MLNLRRVLSYAPVASTYFLFFTILFTACDNGKNPSGSDHEGQYEAPVQRDDGWSTAAPSSVGMDDRLLFDMLDMVENTENHRIHSLLIVKDGHLVFEEYYDGDKFNLAQFTGERGFSIDDTHNLCSVTKSITSALVGIALDKGYIQSIDQKVFEFFPGYSSLFETAPEKRALTLRHLLMMTSGIDWDDESTSYFDGRNDMNQLFNSRDPIQYILSKDMKHTPGTVFDYANCNTNLLGEIIYKASDWRLDVFSRRYLFSKLGITDFEWQKLPDGVIFCSGDLRLRPRDMAKIGSLFLNGGTWNGEQLISKEWIDISTVNHTPPAMLGNNFTWADGYSFHWWVWEKVLNEEFNAYFASGWGGQYIIICPEMNMVVVTTAGNYYTETKISIEYLLANYVIPSVRQE
ncbi:MAG: serine hydrolase [candidate division KSB1 bacterium]|jgi:CubicO group peptidase (beta-lactamase class C family)|nr:serine hydrolase [candidate division KSB1 bacterium]